MRRACLLALLAAVLTPATASASSRILDVPVSFRVRNADTSQVPCLSDGATYVVRGHLTGPRSAIEGPGPRTVTLYYEGFESGEWNWRFRRVPGYDYAAELAALGHVSVTIDQVGYGASGHPLGFATCFGAQADIAHQIIGQLRDRGFQKVVLAGHDIGGGMAEIEAYSYHDIDGLMVFTWQEQGQTPYLLRTVADANARCAAGGEPAYEGGPPGYVYFPHLEDWPLLLPNSEPAVVSGAIASRLRNPCGLVSNSPEAVYFNGAPSETGRGLSTIHVPVLLVLGALDPVFTADGFKQQATRFSGSKDLTSVLMENTGHFEMLDRNAAQFRALVAGWLRSRRLG
jgi:pimeloyl-ACP methyl ester carboxylesterase